MSEPPDVVGDDAASQRSADLLASGQLPSQAQDRLGRLRRDHSFTSDLSTQEFAAIRSVGFQPVGQVLGSCVYQIGYAGTWQCGAWGAYGGGYYGGGGFGGGYPGRYRGGYGPGQMMGPGFPGGRVGRAVGGPGMPGGFAGPLSMGPGPGGPQSGNAGADYPILEPEKMPGSALASPLIHSLREARRLATDRMTAECEALDGDGVVAVRLSFAPFPGSPNAVEFKAIGTAIRGAGERHPKHPFLSDLSGQDFAKLIFAGWVPCGLAIGISVVVRHDSWSTRSATSFANAYNVEVPSYTALVQETRKDARHSLAEQVISFGGEGVVIGDSTLSIGEHECMQVQGGRDHLAESIVVGTALARFTPSHRPAPTSTLAVLRLGDRAGRVERLVAGARPGSI